MGIGFNALGDEPITLESMSKLRAAYDPQLAMQRKLALLQGQGTAAGMDMSQFLNTTSQAPVVVDDEFNVQGSGRMGTAVAGLNAMANAAIGGDIRKQKEADMAQKQGVIDEQRNYTRAMGERGFAMDQDRFSLEGIKQGMEVEKFEDDKKRFGMNYALEQQRLAAQKMQAAAAAEASRASAAASRAQTKMATSRFEEEQKSKRMGTALGDMAWDSAMQTNVGPNGKPLDENTILVNFRNKARAMGASDKEIQQAWQQRAGNVELASTLNPKQQADLNVKKQAADIATAAANMTYTGKVAALNAKYPSAQQAADLRKTYDVKTEGEFYKNVEKGIGNNTWGYGDSKDLKEMVDKINTSREKAAAVTNEKGKADEKGAADVLIGKGATKLSPVALQAAFDSVNKTTTWADNVRITDLREFEKYAIRYQDIIDRAETDEAAKQAALIGLDKTHKENLSKATKDFDSEKRRLRKEQLLLSQVSDNESKQRKK